jgi:hypothetical protein
MIITEGNHDGIRELAYQLWLDAGQPEGRDDEFWYQAERQLAENGEIDSSAEQGSVDKPSLVTAPGPV